MFARLLQFSIANTANPHPAHTILDVKKPTLTTLRVSWRTRGLFLISNLFTTCEIRTVPLRIRSKYLDTTIIVRYTFPRPYFKFSSVSRWVSQIFSARKSSTIFSTFSRHTLFLRPTLSAAVNSRCPNTESKADFV